MGAPAQSPGRLATLVASVLFVVLISFSGMAFVLQLAVTGTSSISPSRWAFVTFAPAALALYGFRRGSLSATGALSAVVVGSTLTLANSAFFASLLVFFLTSSKATKFRQEEKQRLEGPAFKEGGRRNWLQVLCNGGVATELALLYLIDVGCADLPLDFSAEYRGSWLGSAVLGALACCNGDTWASEIGSVVWTEDSPRLITSWRKVPRGTNGGVSPAGVVVSLLGGMAVGAGYYMGVAVTASRISLDRSPNQLYAILLGGLAGLLGSLLDSLLGATIQYSGLDRKTKVVVEEPGADVKHISGLAVIDNHGVNLLSSIVTALVTPKIAIIFF